jgi:hypothetical protein
MKREAAFLMGNPLLPGIYKILYTCGLRVSKTRKPPVPVGNAQLFAPRIHYIVPGIANAAALSNSAARRDAF